jgi:hypothetical protein
VVLKLLNVALIVQDPLANDLDIVGESHRVGVASSLINSRSLGLDIDFPLEPLEFLEVLILHRRVLHFNCVEFLFVFLSVSPEPGCKLFSFLAVEGFVVNIIRLFRLEDFVDRFFKAFIFNFGQFDLVVNTKLGSGNCVFIAKEVGKNLMVESFPLCQSCLQLIVAFVEVSFLQVEFLHAYRSILLVSIYCILK